MEDATQVSADLHAPLQEADLVAAYAEAQVALQHAIGFDTAPDILSALASIGQATRADRAYLFRIREMVYVENTHEWCREGIMPMQAELQQIPFSVGDAFWSGFRRNGCFLLEDIEALAFGSDLRQVLRDQDIRSLIAAPLWRDGEMHGFIGLDYVRGKHHFSQTEIALLKGFAASLDLALHGHERELQRRRMQAEVQSAHDRIGAMVTALPELLIETDARGVVTGFHQSAPMTFALAPEEVIGQPLEAFLPAHVVGMCRKAMVEARQSGWSDMYDYTLQIDGVAKRFVLHVTSSGNARDGRQHGFLFVVRDITESFMQDTRIRQLGRVAELSTNLIMLTDADRNVTWMNPAAVSRTGIALEDAIGQLPSTVLRYSSDDGGVQLRAFCALLDQGQDIEQEVRAIDHRGLPYWLNLNVQPLRDPAGETRGFMVVGSDVTLHKLAEVRALRDRQSAMDASRDAIAIVQPDGQLTYLNPLFRQLLGIPLDVAAETLVWHDIRPESFTPELQTILPELYSAGHWAGEVTLLVPEGADRVFDVSMSVQDDGSFLAIAREVTDRKAAEMQQALLREKLQVAQSRQLVAQLAGGLAHDVANVLAVITQSLEMLKPVVAPPASESLNRIESAAEQARALVGNLSRLGQRSSSRNAIALDQSIRQATDLVRPSLGPEIALHLDLPAAPLEVMGEQTAVMQVMLNLMLNARDALAGTDGTGSAGHIRVRLRRTRAADLAAPLDLGVVIDGQPYGLVEIADSGKGIPPGIRRQMLEPYFTTKGAGGAGLGLSIVTDILQIHEGALRVLSTPGEDTVFQVFWPLLRSSYEPATEPLRDMQILLVDNDDTMLAGLSEALSQAGADPVSCIDPREALGAVRADPACWDAVVTDHDMGSMSGSKLATELHKLNPDLPIFMVTGANKLPCATNPAITMVLRKPVSASVLVNVLLKSKQRHMHRAGETTHDTAPVDSG